MLAPLAMPGRATGRAYASARMEMVDLTPEPRYS